jgi:hypothetical protein
VAAGILKQGLTRKDTFLLTRLVLRWFFRLVIAAAALFVITYLGDWAVFGLRGSPCSTVVVTRLLVIPLKSQKQEFDSLGSAEMRCSISLFPQMGLDTCWYLRRNRDQWVTY